MTAGKGCRSGPGSRIGLAWAALCAFSTAGAAGAVPSAAQAPPRGVLISPGVACRAAASHSASLVDVLSMTGDAGRELVTVRDSASDAAGESWVAVERQTLRGRCWVPEALVVPAYDGASPLLAIADRILEAPAGHSLAHWVAVHTYFRHPAYREDVEASAILALRRLEVLMGALRVAQLRWTDDPDPLLIAWLESLGDDVEYSAERLGRERWTVSRRALDALYELHRADPAAEEILWRIARYPYDPEQCLRLRRLQCLYDTALGGVSRYWRTYPGGAFVEEAMRAAVARIDALGSGIIGGSVLGACEGARAAEPDSWQLEAWQRLNWETEGIAGAGELRASLAAVGEEDRAPLIDYLDELERCAIDVGARLPAGEPEPAAETPAEGGADPAADTAAHTAADPAADPVADPAAETRELAVIASDVVCRFEPSRTVSGYAVLRLDTHFTTDRPDTVAGGEAWVAVPDWWGCWIPLSDTAPAGAAEHVLAIADRFLTSGEGRTLDHSLRVYNVLASRRLGHRAVVDSSAVLTLRRLQVLREVLNAINPSFYNTGAVARGWVTQLDDEVRLWSIGGQWLVRDEAFLRAWETHRDGPWAEAILWEFATGPTPHDCEGSFSCSATVEVMNKLARYWMEYPRGAHVGRAVEIAAARLDGFLGTCEGARGAEPGSRAANSWRWVYWNRDGAGVAGEMRATLSEVGQSDRAPLLELLDGLDRCAAEVGGLSSRR